MLNLVQKPYFWAEKEESVQCILGSNVNVLWVEGEFQEEMK